ncbi:MAG: hypothetical protein MHM6MM_006539 [Cercozoa sp. M6MM]
MADELKRTLFVGTVVSDDQIELEDGTTYTCFEHPDNPKMPRNPVSLDLSDYDEETVTVSAYLVNGKLWGAKVIED